MTRIFDKVWDLKPPGGGPPVQVELGNSAHEAVARDPKRYAHDLPKAKRAVKRAVKRVARKVAKRRAKR